MHYCTRVEWFILCSNCILSYSAVLCIWASSPVLLWRLSTERVENSMYRILRSFEIYFNSIYFLVFYSISRHVLNVIWLQILVTTSQTWCHVSPSMPFIGHVVKEQNLGHSNRLNMSSLKNHPINYFVRMWEKAKQIT